MEDAPAPSAFTAEMSSHATAFTSVPLSWDKGLCIYLAKDAEKSLRLRLIQLLAEQCRHAQGPRNVAVVRLKWVPSFDGKAQQLKIGGVTWDGYWAERTTQIGLLLQQNVRYVLNRSGQWRLLQENCDPRFEYSVSLDYYHNRPLAEAGFHKDTLGNTMFINLAFVNERPLVGPEWFIDLGPNLSDPRKLRDHERALPSWFLKALKSQRSAWASRPSKNRVRVKLIDACATVCFNDALVIHSTPLLGHRVEVAGYGEHFRIEVPEVTHPPVDRELDRRLSARLEDKDWATAVKETRVATRSFLRHEVRAISI